MQPLANITPPGFVERMRNLALMFAEQPEEIKGCLESEVQAAEKRLGFKLPQALRDLYLNVGQFEPAMSAFHRFEPLDEIVNYTGVEEDIFSDLTPEQLLARNGDLVFASENQGCWFARYQAKTGQVYLDLMTESIENPENKSHHHASPNLEDAILWILASQGLNYDLDAGELSVSAQQTPEFMAKLTTYFQPYTTQMDSGLGNVYFSPEGLVVIGSIVEDKFSGYIVGKNNDVFEQYEDDADTDEDDIDADEPEGLLGEFEKLFNVEISYF